MGSGWKIVSIDKLVVDIFETRPLRGSSYIETPDKYSNAKMRANQHQERGRGVLQMVHEVSPVRQSKNTDRVSALKKINDKYNYDGMVFPADYTSIEAFEELNKVCIFPRRDRRGGQATTEQC